MTSGSDVAPPAASRGGNSNGPAVPARDACAMRLHDISGLLLHYFVVNSRLPDRLEDLAPLADAGMKFEPTCPVSDRPFVYAPGGLPGTGTDRLLLVYEAVSAHDGKRWAILASPAQGSQPLATWVVLLNEQRFRAHQPG